MFNGDGHESKRTRHDMTCRQVFPRAGRVGLGGEIN